MTNKKSYSATELAEMKLPHLPTTKKGWLDLVKREKWVSVMVPGGRGCKGGLKREYYPSKAVAALIESAQHNEQEANTSNHYPASTAKPLISGSGQHSGLTVQSHSSNGDRVNNFITLPKHVLQTMPDQVIRSDQVVDYLAFNKDWLGESLNIYDSSLALIKIKDDNMEPTLAKDDLILTELNQGEIDGDSIYVLRFGNTLTLRRIQRKMDGSLLVFSDNKKYKEEEFNGDKAKNLPVVGKVVLYVRRI